MLHGVASDQRACSSESSFAVHSYATGLIFTDSQKFIYNFVGRSASVDEKEVCMLNAVLQEPVFVVFNIIKSNDVSYAKVLENLNVIFRTIALSVVLSVHRAHERDELPRDSPVKVSVLNFFVVLVLLGVECSKIIPTMHDGQLKSFEAMVDSAVVVAISVGCVSKRPDYVVVRLKGVPSILCAHLEYYDHESAH
jgi:hypothetical protein